MAIRASFDITGDTDRVVRKLNNFAQSQVKWATVLTINETGMFLLNQNKKHMKRTFASANRYTMNAFYFKRANKQTMTGTLRRKDKPSGRHYLEVQQKGGLRPRKAVETKLEYNLGYEGIMTSVTPTTRAEKGKYGGIKMSIVNQVLGSKDTKAGVRYFFAGPFSLTKFGGGNKTGGIYRVTGNGRPQKMFHFHDRSFNYKPKFDFYGNMNRHAGNHFRMRFNANIKKAMATSKYGLDRL